jgi:DNA-binding MarR family transcriptional regulator
MAVSKRAQTKVKPGKPLEKPSAKPFRFGFLVHDVSRMRRTLFDQEMKPLGVTRSQWYVLASLSRGGNDGVMQVDLARLMELGKVTVGGLIDRLEASGQVERRPDPHDRRARRVFITEGGFETIRKMQSVGNELNRSILKGVSAEQLRITEQTLARVKENIRELLAGEVDAAEEEDV